MIKKVLIVDDDVPCSIDIEMMLDKIGNFDCTVVNNYQDCLKFLFSHMVDLIISDIFLNGDHKIYDVFDQVKIDCPVIFMSSDDTLDNYKRAVQYDAYIYLVKPFNFITLKSAIDKCQSEAANKLSESPILIKEKGQLIPILRSEILFISTEGNYCTIHTIRAKVITRETLKTLMDRLNAIYIIQVHRRFAVNLNRVERVDIANNSIYGFTELLPLGRRYKASVKQFILKK